MWKRKETVKDIPLMEWQDPQEDVLLLFSERLCDVYFRCWDDEKNPAKDIIGKLEFVDV